MRLFVIYIFLITVAHVNAQIITNEAWIEDLDFYHKTLEDKHIDLYHIISKEEFSKDIQLIKDKLPQLTDFQVTVELMRLTHKVGNGKGDGHTAVPLWGIKVNKFPIKLFDFGNDIRVIETSKEYEHILGKRLKSINGKPIKDVYSKVSELMPFTENNQSSMDRVCQYMVVSELLVALEITNQVNSTEFIFVDDDNTEEKVIINAYSKEKRNSFKYKEISISNPKIFRPKEVKYDNLWFTSLNNSKTVYINFKHYPSEEEMNTFSKGIYKFIDQHQSKSLIIDLRDNYGGDFYIGLFLSGWLNALDSINWKSNVYVLVNRKTYSAAMVNATQFKQLLNAKIVGEPTGANPNGYQDMGTFKLPNSELLISYTKRLFRLQDKNTKGLQPDILILPNWEDYKRGYDKVLDWVLNDINSY